jgi:quercetin dioxygenase-like cupin family protein
MTQSVRRIVTGHHANGKAKVLIDETVTNVKVGRPGAIVHAIWTSEGFPVNNDGDADAGARPVGTTLENGIVCRVVRFEPGVQERNHRTDSLDYAIVLDGEIDMELDDETVHVKAGDVLVQRGTIHNWINRGPNPCTICFVLIAARSATAGGKTLEAMG